MNTVSASAPGKIILFGEHAVVYGRPAMAMPVSQVRATATVVPGAAGRGLRLRAPDLGWESTLDTAAPGHPLAAAARELLQHLGQPTPDAELSVTSTIPVAGGMGSGAAVSTAAVRALARFLGHDLPLGTISALVYEVEKIHHGTPSGIDNTVVAFERPVYFVRGREPETLDVGAPLHWLIADSGQGSPTREVVGDLRRRYERRPAHYKLLFDRVGELVTAARAALQAGDAAGLGCLMDRNHALLVELGISNPILERLVLAARAAGALGAKLSGAGWGGNVVALVEEGGAGGVRAALEAAGAVRTIATQLDKSVIPTQ